MNGLKKRFKNKIIRSRALEMGFQASRHFQPAIWRILHVEFESEPQNHKIRHHSLKNHRNDTKKRSENYFVIGSLYFAVFFASEGIPGVDLDMPDSILTSLDLRNHQKHPKQKKERTQNKVKTFFFWSLICL